MPKQNKPLLQKKQINLQYANFLSNILFFAMQIFSPSD